MSKPAAAIDEVVTAQTSKGLGDGGAVAAAQGIIEHRRLDGVDATEGVGACRSITGRSTGAGRRACLHVDGNGAGRVDEGQPCIAVTDDVVVTSHADEFVEGTVGTDIGAGAAKAGRIETVGAIRTAHGFDRSKRIGADRGGIACHDSRSQTDGDTAHRRRIECIVSAIEAGPSVDEIIAGATFEYLNRSGSVAAAEQLVGRSRADYACKSRTDKGIITIAAGRRVRVEIDSNAARALA